jgi:uncharacterized protein (DUF362 family)
MTPMTPTNDRRRFLQQMLALAATGLAASACRQAKAPDGAPTTSRPSPTEAPTTAPRARTATKAPEVTQKAQLELQATQPVPSPTGTAASAATATTAGLAVARGAGADPAELTRRAIAALGGIERFVKPGANVVVKPNICVAYHGPEYAATTNPDVVAAVVALCLGAGAARVRVMDAPFGGTAQNAYDRSGIAEAVGKAGGQMEVMSRMKFRPLAIPAGRAIKEWRAYGDALDADVLISIPIAKDHGSTRLSLGMKNLMGLIESRNAFHSRGLHECIADLSSALRPHLTIVDAVRILMENGPTGGNLDDVKRTDTVIASADPVAADAFATSLFNLAPKDIGYIQLGAEMGLGEMDLGKVHVAEVQV